jgi:tripartite-type tricarboxylate transporter receptor subunit TctC
VQQGKLRGLAIASAARFAGLPDVPTADEAGLSGFEASVWYAILAPVRTPQPVIAKINAALNEFLPTPQTKETFETMGIQVAGGTPEQAKTFIASEIEKWAPIIKEANIEF